MNEKPNQRFKIVVGYHKEHSQYLQNEVLLPLFMGRSPEYGPMIDSDNTGDNISDKNYLYCELTGTYWLWKNVQADVKGLFHYRRVLASETAAFSPWRMVLRYNYYRIKSLFTNKPFLIQNKRRVQDVGAYMEEAMKFSKRIPSLFNEQLSLITRKIEDVAPDYLNEFKETLAATTMTYANIIVARNAIFDEYCNYVFSVLFAVEKSIVDEGYWRDLHEKSLFRRFGYIGELLTSSFVLHCERKGLYVLRAPVLENS